jgi:hypothetical protein
MSVGQSDFSRAILDPDLAVPSGLTDPQGRPAGKRFSVYRNNVAVSLTEALETAYPVVRKLVGDEFFKAMAGVYLRQHPPTSALMLYYGSRFSAFLESFEPVRTIGYLPDVARLERALRQSYHAADAAPIDPAVLQVLPPDRLMAARLYLAPAVRLVRSRWPIHALWLANTKSDAPKPQMKPEDVLITRPGFDPEPQLLGSGASEFVAMIGKGEIFAKAMQAADEGFDLTALLGQLLAGGAITGISEGI